ETLGDLNALVDVDQERAVDWANIPPLSDSAEILRSHAKEKIEGDIGITFQPRVQQEKMASLVQKGLLAGERISIEAPTGTGKSIAYLLPGMLTAEATGVPLVISTATKSLQDQLFRKDRVIVEKFLGGRESKIVTLKGQDNYVCLRKLYKQLDELLEFGQDIATLDE